MGNYEELKAAVAAVIKQNGNEEITGQIMQNTLLSMISNIGANSTFAGVATPETAPGTPDQNVFYLAGTPGVYANFGGYELKQGIVIFTNASGSFTAVDLGINNNDVMMKFLPDKSIIGIPNVDYNHICNISSDGAFTGYIENANYDAAWILIPIDNGYINLTGATFRRVFFFNDINPIEENYISNVSSNFENIPIPQNAKLAIVNMSKAQNPNGYKNIKVKQIGGATNFKDLNELKQDLISIDKITARQIFVDYNHICNISSDGAFMGYIETSTHDAAWINLLDGVKQLNVLGATPTRFNYFSALEPTTDNYIFNDKMGVVPDNAVLCIINMSHNDNPNGYENIKVEQMLNYVDNTRFNNLFGDYIINIPTGKNYIDPNNLLPGYIISSGQIVPHPQGIMSNKIYLTNGEVYTMQGIFFYGLANAIYIAYYGENNVYLGRGQFNAIYEEGQHYGNATFTFDDNNGSIKYVRICLQTSTTYPFNKEIAQLELGDRATAVEQYQGVENVVFPTSDNGGKKKIRILSIGNSYSQDALSYIPFILPNIQKNIDIEIGILYMSGATLQQHYNNFVNETPAYTYFLFNGGISWQNLGSYTIQQALKSQSWDIILLQQGSTSSWTWATYQPYLNQLINLIYGQIDYPVRFGWMLTQSRPKTGNTVYTDEEIISHYNAIAENSQKVLDETLCDFIFPVGTAVQNARTTSLNDLGDYGKLCSSDGGHLQEGLPSQLAAYTCIVELLRLSGYGINSIYGENTRVTTEWVQGKNIPGPNGSPVGSTDENCAIAQRCVIMAIKHPYKITDMTDINV